MTTRSASSLPAHTSPARRGAESCSVVSSFRPGAGRSRSSARRFSRCRSSSSSRSCWGPSALFRRWALLAGLLVAGGGRGVARPTQQLPAPIRSTGASRAGRLEPTEAVVLGAALALAFEPYLRRVGTVYRRGMLEWDTHWYHAPVAARFAETGDLTQLHAVNNSADSFLPFNTELLHAAGMLATGRGRPLAADQPRLACARRARGVVPRPRLERRRRGRRGDGGRGGDSRDGLRVCGGPPGTTSPGSRCCSPPRRLSSAARRRRGWRGSPGSRRGSRWGRS